jgi:hypothetical protein
MPIGRNRQGIVARKIFFNIQKVMGTICLADHEAAEDNMLSVNPMNGFKRIYTKYNPTVTNAIPSTHFIFSTKSPHPFKESVDIAVNVLGLHR